MQTLVHRHEYRLEKDPHPAEMDQWTQTIPAQNLHMSEVLLVPGMFYDCPTTHRFWYLRSHEIFTVSPIGCEEERWPLTVSSLTMTLQNPLRFRLTTPHHDGATVMIMAAN